MTQAGCSRSAASVGNPQSAEPHATTMMHMTPSLFQEQLGNHGIALSHDHALWMVEQVTAVDGTPADIRNKMIYIVQYAARVGWLTLSNAAALSSKRQTLVMQTLAEVLGHPDPTVRASGNSVGQQGHLPQVCINPPPDDPFEFAAWCAELEIMN